jgi:hypothetical protein
MLHSKLKTCSRLKIYFQCVVRHCSYEHCSKEYSNTIDQTDSLDLTVTVTITLPPKDNHYPKSKHFYWCTYSTSVIK